MNADSHRSLQTLLLAAALALAALPAAAQKRAPLFDRAKLVDLTYSFDERTVYWPTARPFSLHINNWGLAPGGYWYSSAEFSASEHGGTHIDSPIHFGLRKWTTDDIPVERLTGPAVVIDVSAQCAAHPDYLLTAEDVAAWEKRHGRIRAGAIALVRTGWGHYWPEKKRYLGSDAPGDTQNLHFPGISRPAAELLAARQVAGVGIDTASLDYGQSRDFQAHRVLNGANIYGLENVANLDRLPPTGATLIALPIKIRGGTGGPVRILAVLP